MGRLKLTLAYRGSRYCGWQMQLAASEHEKALARIGTERLCPTVPHPPSIQEELERAVAFFARQRLCVIGAGRTDAGVHAEGQVCHLDVPPDKMRIDWKKALNTRLPSDIRVLSAQWVNENFHARKSALQKRYTYTLWSAQDRATPRVSDVAASVPVLDFERINGCLALLTGRRDFASFQNSGSEQRGTVRTLYSIRMLAGRAGPLLCPPQWPVTTFEFCGDGFLKQMVRNLMGLLIWVGLGKTRPEDIPAVFEAKTRTALKSPSAPAHGLTLQEVVYETSLQTSV